MDAKEIKNIDACVNIGVLRNKKVIILIAVAVLFNTSCREAKQNGTKKQGEKRMGIKITSTAFKDGGIIPSKYTCDGKNISPPLQWDAVAGETRSIAVICDDPDAPMGTWVHWVLFNLPPQTTQLPEDFPNDETLDDGTRQGVTDFGTAGYGGPCPPSGTHRYFFKIYALDTEIAVVSVIDKTELLKKMEGHIIAQGQLMAKYTLKGSKFPR